MYLGGVIAEGTPSRGASRSAGLLIPPLNSLTLESLIACTGKTSGYLSLCDMRSVIWPRILAGAEIEQRVSGSIVYSQQGLLQLKRLCTAYDLVAVLDSVTPAQ